MRPPPLAAWCARCVRRARVSAVPRRVRSGGGAVLRVLRPWFLFVFACGPNQLAGRRACRCRPRCQLAHNILAPAAGGGAWSPPACCCVTQIVVSQCRQARRSRQTTAQCGCWCGAERDAFAVWGASGACTCFWWSWWSSFRMCFAAHRVLGAVCGGIVFLRGRHPFVCRLRQLPALRESPSSCSTREPSSPLCLSVSPCACCWLSNVPAVMRASKCCAELCG